MTCLRCDSPHHVTTRCPLLARDRARRAHCLLCAAVTHSSADHVIARGLTVAASKLYAELARTTSH